MPAARSPFRWLVATMAGRVGAGAAMLAAAAAVVLTGGGGGMFGALGSLVSGAGARSVVEEPLRAAADGTPAGAIVATPAAADVAGAGDRTRGRRGGRGGDRGRGGSGRGRPGPGGPGGGGPGGGGPGGGGGGGGSGGGGGPGGGGGGGGGGGSGGGGGRGGVVDSAGQSVQDAVRQAPEPLRPVTDPVDRAVGTVRDTCRGTSVCP